MNSNPTSDEEEEFEKVPDLPEFKRPFSPVVSPRKEKKFWDYFSEKDILTSDPRHCKYMTHLSGKSEKPCNFKIIKIPSRIQDILRGCLRTSDVFVIIPERTSLFRGTLEYREMGKIVPYVLGKNFGWFTSTIEHQGNINFTRIDEYKTTKRLLCIFQPSLRKHLQVTGNSYYSWINVFNKGLLKCKNKIDTENEILNLLPHGGLELDGYIGCDECEIGLTRRAIETSVKLYKEKVVTKDMKYID